jgi:hypothetical protein
MKPKISFIGLLLLVVLGTGLLPQTALSRDRGNGHEQQSGVPWGALSTDEQAALKDYHRNWQGYSPAEQNKLRHGARRYLDLPPQDRDAVKRKQQQYKKMSPQEREELREKYRKQRD